MAKKTIFEKMNAFEQDKTPFFFIVSYDGKEGEVLPLSETAENDIYFQTPDVQNFGAEKETLTHVVWNTFPIALEKYKEGFDQVKNAIQQGDTYLLNYTCETPVQTNHSLEQLFLAASAKYKLFYKDLFIHFSPEPFVKIIDNTISSFPMKGTIDGRLKDALKQIIENEKELHEQFTIVDLIRNDLSIVAEHVRVENFRYVEKIKTQGSELLAVSSKIKGNIKKEFKQKTGSIMEKLLPAGSICGAPKAKTIEIIRSVETHERGYYTGVWGIYNGREVDSCVIIRYLEKRAHGFIFKSGGGITSQSICEKEYQEMKEKVYVPIY